jgi:hypothetical protein
MPALSDFGITAGVIFLVSSYGYYTGQKWAFPASIVASALALQGSWFINVPMMAAGLPPIYFTIFWPNLLGYFLLVKVVGERSWKRTLLGLGTGMAFIFCFMNGVASWSRIITIGTEIFVLVQRMNWIASIGFFVVTVGVTAERVDAGGGYVCWIARACRRNPACNCHDFKLGSLLTVLVWADYGDGSLGVVHLARCVGTIDC